MALFLSAEVRCQMHVSTDEAVFAIDNRDFSTATLDDLEFKVIELVPKLDYIL